MSRSDTERNSRAGFLEHFEDEFSHAPESKLPMPERQVPAWRMSADALVDRRRAIFGQGASSLQILLETVQRQFRRSCHQNSI
jgi:hypothetical protein